jgi:hypothetical protein
VYDGSDELVMAWHLSLDLIAFLFVLLSVLFCTFFGAGERGLGPRGLKISTAGHISACESVPELEKTI